MSLTFQKISEQVISTCVSAPSAEPSLEETDEGEDEEEESADEAYLGPRVARSPIALRINVMAVVISAKESPMNTLNLKMIILLNKR